MSGDRTEEILDAAYACFTRHGVRRTTVEDIAGEAGISRAAVYQYVRNKDDALRRLVARLFDETLANAHHASMTNGALAQRLEAALAAKLELTLRIWRDSPHAAELIGTGSRLSADLESEFTAAMRSLLADTIGAERPDADANELADVLLALTRGLEADGDNPSDASGPRRLLHRGVFLTIAGLATTESPTSTLEESS